MRARILTAAFCLLPVVAWAQDGLRSASLPERPLTSALSPARVDLFLAEPDTYTSRKDRRDVPVPFFGHIPVYGYMSEVFPYPDAWHGGYKQRAGEVRSHRHRRVGSAPPRRHDSWGQPPPVASAPPPPAVPGVPKTFYVIAGCYAGDKPPRPEWLAPDCDLSRVRVIPP